MGDDAAEDGGEENCEGEHEDGGEGLHLEWVFGFVCGG